MSLSKLPWSKDEYKKLEPGDLLPEPAPTPEQRIRVVAALATHMRDRQMLGHAPEANSEAIRGLLVMSADEWVHAMASLPSGIIVAYDPVDPSLRMQQTVKFVQDMQQEEKCNPSN